MGTLRNNLRMMVEKPPGRRMIRAQEGNFKMEPSAMDCED
jgi:hypothetical protein